MALTPANKIIASLIDQVVWNNASPNAATTGELRLLRGIHNKLSLNCLKVFLQGIYPGKNINLCSVWVDKTPQAFYQKGNKQKGNTELADLLVYVRTRTPSGVTRRAILLQGKPIFKRLQSYGSGGSTPKEEYLYKNCPKFDLRSHGGTVGSPLGTASFDLKKLYPALPGKKWASLSNNQLHWRFLSICRSQTDYLKWTPESPFHTRWPVKSKAPGEGLAEVIADMLAPTPTLGLPVEDINGADDWKRLVNTLIAYTRAGAITWDKGTSKRKRNIRCFMIDRAPRPLGIRKISFGFDPEAFESTYDNELGGPFALLGAPRNYKHILERDDGEDELLVSDHFVAQLPPGGSGDNKEEPSGGGISMLIVDVNVDE